MPALGAEIRVQSILGVPENTSQRILKYENTRKHEVSEYQKGHQRVPGSTESTREY
jgi:hypothetical protein